MDKEIRKEPSQRQLFTENAKINSMLKTMKALVRDNSGDENITKMFWVAIVFIVGAILLVMVSTAFNGPIHDLYQKIINGWFDKNGSNGAFPDYTTATVSAA